MISSLSTRSFARFSQAAGGRLARAIRIAATLALLLPFSPSAHAQGIPSLGSPPRERQPKTGEELVQARAFVVGDAKPGATVRVAVEFTIEKDWHIYWMNSGESGLPTDVAFELPAGCSAPRDNAGRLAVDFPVPQVFTHGETTFGFENRVVLSVPVTLPQTIDAAGLPIVVRSSWLVCKGQCLSGRSESTVDLSRPVAKQSPEAKALAEALTKVPKMLTSAETSVNATVTKSDEDSAELQISWKGSGPVRFIPFDTPGVVLASGYMAEGDASPLRVRLDLSPESALGRALEVGGIVVVGEKSAAHAFRIPIPPSAKGATAP